MSVDIFEMKHMLLEVRSCREKEWLHQDVLEREEDYVKLYELEGNLLYSNGTEFEDHRRGKDGRKRGLEEVVVYVDKDVSEHKEVIIQEVLQYKNETVGTVAMTSPKRLGEDTKSALFTGVVLGEQEVPISEEASVRFTTVYIDIGGKGEFRECGVFEGLQVVEGEGILGYDEAHLGSVVRFSVREDEMEYYEKDERYVFDRVTIINRYN